MTRERRNDNDDDSWVSKSTCMSTSAHSSETKTSSTRQSYGSTMSRSRHDDQVYVYGSTQSTTTDTDARSSVASYASMTASEDGDCCCALLDEDDVSDEPDGMPPLPVYYRGDVVEQHKVRASTPEDFAKLFPSLNRLTIRHDDFRPDGNMNLRVDMTHGHGTAIQLFHLRMYDLSKRDFSLRRYCRDSGREVCNSKRQYSDPAAAHHPADERHSLSTALKTLGGRRGSHSSATSKARPRPSPWSSDDGDDYHDDDDDEDGDDDGDDGGDDDDRESRAHIRAQPTNTIKLEFTNYARVDVHATRAGKRYDFEWWGHRYSWRRSVDKQLGRSFHLVRDGHAGAPVAHMVPDSVDDEHGWVPPYCMWIADESVVDAVTDVADVIVATGLMALVDDCIKQRWENKKTMHHRVPLPLRARAMSIGSVSPKSVMQHVFGRRNSESSRPRHAAHAITAH